MSAEREFDLDTFLDARPVDSVNPDRFDLGPAERTGGESWHEPGYTGSIDYRIRQLSYSSLLTLHECPRKFQLYKLRSTGAAEESIKSSVTFAYGHTIGRAIQSCFEGKSLQDIFLEAFLHWKPDLMDEIEKDNKSFWSALISIQRFVAARKSGFLDDYELVYYDSRPACELSFCIVFPDGFRLRGHVDAVLRHRLTGEIVVLECKTSNANAVNPATYKNSAQAIGYSIVLDSLFEDLSSYDVLYLVNLSKSSTYEPIKFTKTYLQRALWIRELLLDIETIKMYEEAGVYPMHGESCFKFFRECEYLQVCTLSTDALTKPCTEEQEDKIDYQVQLTLSDLLDTQLRKVEGV